jgi:hypothetical protein
VRSGRGFSGGKNDFGTVLVKSFPVVISLCLSLLTLFLFSYLLYCFPLPLSEEEVVKLDLILEQHSSTM